MIFFKLLKPWSLWLLCLLHVMMDVLQQSTAASLGSVLLSLFAFGVGGGLTPSILGRAAHAVMAFRAYVDSADVGSAPALLLGVGLTLLQLIIPITLACTFAAKKEGMIEAFARTCTSPIELLIGVMKLVVGHPVQIRSQLMSTWAAVWIYSVWGVAIPLAVAGGWMVLENVAKKQTYEWDLSDGLGQMISETLGWSSKQPLNISERTLDII